MITGCNTNILYRGKQFHVQTEDSGRANPHIISHVYHGGTIIATEKSEYGDRIGSTELDVHVRAKIELQHSAMLKRLTSGELDALIDERIGGASRAPKSQPSGAAKPPASAAPKSQPTSAAKPAPSLAAAPAAPVASNPGDTLGSITPGADTHPSLQDGKSAPDTKPMLGKSSAAAFGDGLDSEKPLDEVILEFLVDKARGRAAKQGQTATRQPRRKE
jgi:hypothetical protein